MSATISPEVLDKLESRLKALSSYDIATGGLRYAPADRATGNAVIAPAGDPEGDWFTLIGGGPEDQQNALCEVIVGAVNALPALIAAARHQQPEGWRDIATAPKDGSKILVGFQGQFDWMQYVAYSAGPDTQSAGFARPTHWQPLPAPPARGGS